MPGQPPGSDAVSGMTPGGLIGRAAEVAAIGRLLGSGRLVTVTGLPGVGKTAVGLAAASAVSGNLADGALLVRLDTLRDDALLPHTVAAAAWLEDRFTGSGLDVLLSQLRHRDMLLVFDTCEHLLGASAALASALLPACPGVRILATSREPLRVPGESATVIRPLGLGDAVALFTRRAAQARIRLGAGHRAAVASACTLLDRLPLAIELAVRQLAGTRPLSASMARLLSGLQAGDDLPDDADEAAGRHQTLRAAIGWSHELCTPDERLLWARLSVFTGPFLIRHAQDVCTTSELPDETVETCLTLLAERSVLLAERQVGGGMLYLLPATLRAYGRRMLRRLGQEEEFADRHRRWRWRREVPGFRDRL
jgi:predicted ATPase